MDGLALHSLAERNGRMTYFEQCWLDAQTSDPETGAPMTPDQEVEHLRKLSIELMRLNRNLQKSIVTNREESRKVDDVLFEKIGNLEEALNGRPGTDGLLVRMSRNEDKAANWIFYRDKIVVAVLTAIALAACGVWGFLKR